MNSNYSICSFGSSSSHVSHPPGLTYGAHHLEPTRTASEPVEPQWKITLIEQLFRHIHGDRELAGGMGSGINMGRVHAWLQDYCHDRWPSLAPLLNWIDPCSDIDAIPRLQAHLEHLKIGDKILMRGGWRTASGLGHAMLYCFERQSSVFYSLYVFNTGEGTGQYHPFLEDEGKKKICPFVWYSSISWHQISTILPKIVDLVTEKVIVPTEQDPSFILYSDILERELGYPSPSEKTFFITKQRAGTCAYRIFLAWFQFAFNNEELYKQWHHTLHTDSLTAFTLTAMGRKISSSTTAFWVQVAARNTLYSAHKLLERGKISECTAHATHQVCTVALQRIAALPRHQEDLNEEVPYDLDDAQPFQEWMKAVRSQDLQIPTRLVSPLQMLRVCHSDANLEEGLQSLNSLCMIKNVMHQDRISSMLAIDHVVRTLPIDALLWDGNLLIRYGGIRSVAQQLYSLQITHIQMLCNEPQRLPRHLNTQLRMIALLHLLACLDEPELSEYSFSCPRPDSIQDPFLLYFDAVEWEQSHRLMQYFRSTTRPSALQLCKYESDTTFSIWKTVSADPESSDYFLLHGEGDFLARKRVQTHLRSSGREENINQKLDGSELFSRIIAFYREETPDLPLSYLNRAILNWHQFITHSFKDASNTNWCYTRDIIAYISSSPDAFPVGLCLGMSLHIPESHGEWNFTESIQRYRENPLTMLTELALQISVLDSPSVQTEFEVILFPSGRGTLESPHHPLQHAIQDASRMYLEFLALGQAHVVRLPEDQMSPRLFWVRCTQRLCQILPATFLCLVKEQIAQLHSWLNRDYETLQMKSVIHLYLAHAYVLLGIEQLTAELKEQLIISWIWVLYQKIPDQEQRPDIMAAIRISILQHQSVLWEYLDSHNLNLKPLMAGWEQKTDAAPWTCRRRGWILDLSCSEALNIYSIHLLSGNHSIITKPNLDVFLSFSREKRLFNHTLQLLVSSEAYTLCAHKGYGRIRFWYSHGWQVERRVGGLWYRYIDPQSTRSKEIPYNLWWTHSHWILLPGQQAAENAPLVVVSPLGEGQIVYEMHLDRPNGTPKYWQMIMPQLKFSGIMPLQPIKGCHVQPLSANWREPVSRFESPDHVWIEWASHEPKCIVFPRFRNEDGSTLQFHYHEDRWKWNGGSAFYWQWSSERLPHLGNFHNFLCLKNDQSDAIIMMPVYATRWSQSFVLEVNFDMQGCNPGMNLYEESLHRQQRYVIYDWNGEKLAPRSRGASCFLAYLYFVCRAYAPAVELLQQLGYGEPLASEDCEILDLFLDQKSWVDSSPSAAAVRLYAIALQARTRINLDLRSINEYARKYSKAAWKVPASIQPNRNVWRMLEQVGVSVRRLSKLMSRDLAAIITYPEFEDSAIIAYPEFEDLAESSMSATRLQEIGSTFLIKVPYKTFRDPIAENTGWATEILPQTVYELPAQEDIQKCARTLFQFIQWVQNETTALGERIHDLANLRRSISGQLLSSGGFLLYYSITECIHWFGACRGSFCSFQNNDLFANEMTDLIAMIQSYLEWATQGQQAQRALDALQMAMASIGEFSGLSIAWSNRMGRELEGRIAYNPSKRPEMLVFEYQTGIRMHPRQVQWIEELGRELRAQTVYGCHNEIRQIIPLLLFTIAQSEKIPIIVVSDTQHTAWKTHLQQQLTGCFHQSLHSVDLPQYQWTHDALQQLRNELRLAQQGKGACVLSRSVLASLQLKLFSLLDSHNMINDLDLELTSEIFTILYQKGHLIYDPLEGSFSPLLELRKPIDKVTILPAFATAPLRQLFDILCRDPDSNFETPLQAGMGFMNGRKIPSRLAFLESMAPILACRWMHLHRFDALSKYEDAFVRFATGQIGMEQDPEIDFSRTLQSWMDGQDETLRCTAKEVHLIRYFLSSLMPFVLEHHRRLCTVSARQPMSGIEDPWVYMAHVFFQVCYQGLSYSQIKRWQESMLYLAIIEGQQQQLPLADTSAGRRYAEWTGLTLSRSPPSDEVLAAVGQELSLHPDRMIEVVALLPIPVLQSTQYVASNTQDLLALFPPAHRVALLNMPFHDAFGGATGADALEQQRDMEQRLLTRIAECIMPVVVLSVPDVRELLEKGAVIGSVGVYILDLADMFENWILADLACEMIEYMTDLGIGDSIDAVLFFKDNHLMAWRPQDPNPIQIGNRSHLSDYGISLNRCITWYRRQDAENVHLDHPVGTRGLIIANFKMDLRLLYRNPCCMAEDPYSYPMQFVISHSEVRELPPEQDILHQLVTAATINQRRTMQEHAFYTYRQRLHGVMRSWWWQVYVQLTRSEERRYWIQQYRCELIQTARPAPCEPYATALEWIDTQEFFLALASRIIQSIRSYPHLSSVDQEELTANIRSILTEIQQSNHLPQYMQIGAIRDWEMGAFSSTT